MPDSLASVAAWLGGRRPRLTRAEQRLWDAYPTGALVSLGDERPSTGGSPDRTIRAEVISALLLGACEPKPGHVPAVRLRGARITGPLNVSGGEVGCELRLERCVLEEAPDFSNARARQMRLNACRLPGFDGGGLQVDGYLSLSESLIDGEVRLMRASLSGGLRMNSVRLRNPGGYALTAGGLTVDAGAFIRNSDIAGRLRLTGARMTGGLFLYGTTLRDPDCVLDGDNMTVQDRMECSAGFTAEGPMRLRGARIDGTLSFDQGAIRAPGRRALHLSHADVKELILIPREPIQGEVTLGYSRIDVILDRPDVWPEQLRLNGLVYETLRGEPEEGQRLDWISRDPHGFRPQPYEQLASWLRRIGRDDLARKCQLAKQRARRRQLGRISRAWSLLLDWTVGYGYRPWIAAVWLMVLVAVGTVVFSIDHPRTIKQPDERPHFHALIYTLDLMLPIETFGQRSAWDPIGWSRWLAWTLTGTGWILATALISGVARVLRPS
ncbi:oxidoreductase [Actinoallomurus vinaceus]|uniref:Oxidoreductase n=1 Tax=Actinoallomurus vinaceus TaxID=1080074 RepID=A0ABP8UEZ6_9ACTN